MSVSGGTDSVSSCSAAILDQGDPRHNGAGGAGRAPGDLKGGLIPFSSAGPPNASAWSTIAGDPRPPWFGRG